MKANAPEKIYVYIPDDDIVGTASIQKGFPHQFVTKEYTSADSFIEKACEWLRTHSEMDFFELIPVANYCGAGNLNKKKMIEDFRNYMKGE